MLTQDQQALSHEQRIAEQEKRLGIHSETIERHAERLEEDRKEIEKLKVRDDDKHLRMLEIEANYENLEKTVTKENKETRATMREQSEKLFSIVEQAMGYQESRTSQSHDFKMAKLNTWSTVFLKLSGGIVALLSSGGAIFYIIQSIVEK